MLSKTLRLFAIAIGVVASIWTVWSLTRAHMLPRQFERIAARDSKQRVVLLGAPKSIEKCGEPFTRVLNQVVLRIFFMLHPTPLSSPNTGPYRSTKVGRLLINITTFLLRAHFSTRENSPVVALTAIRNFGMSRSVP